jgi:hypothetical protein
MTTATAAAAVTRGRAIPGGDDEVANTNCPGSAVKLFYMSASFLGSI